MFCNQKRTYRTSTFMMALFLCWNISSAQIDTIFNSDSLQLQFVGGGDLQYLSNGMDDNPKANISLGLYLQRIFNPKTTFLLKNIEVDFGINVASTSDSLIGTDPRLFGSYILNPINSVQSARLDMYALFKDKKPNIFNNIIDGLYFRFYADNKYWSNGTQSTNVTGIHYRIGLFHEFIPDAISIASNTSVMLGLGYASRGVFGDINQDNNDTTLSDFIGTNRNVYRGMDFFFGVKVNNIRAEFTVPFIKGGNNPVPGLTNTQFITTVRFVGGFPISINSGKSGQNKIGL